MEKHRRKTLEKIFQAALSAVNPEKAVKNFVQRIGNQLLIGDRSYDLNKFNSIILTGAGKGSAPMAKALEDLLGDSLTAGCIIVKYGHAIHLRKTEVIEAGHPIPDEAGVHGTERILQQLQQCSKEDLVLCVFSGGGSALLPAPLATISLSQKQKITRLLIDCGATIDEINAVRKHLSRVKGGGLARAACPATVVSLILSDVIDDRLDVIASGPTFPDQSTYQDCVHIVKKYALSDRLPLEVGVILEEGAAGRRPETPKTGDPIFFNVQNLIVGNNRAALLAASKEALAAGYKTLVLSSRIKGEAREVAKVFAAIGKEIRDSGFSIIPPTCVLAGGETTVTIQGSGKGGRNQELALSAAIELEGWDRIALLSAGTDGTDGPTDAAGAFADGVTCQNARHAGMMPLDYLSRNDSYDLFDKIGDLFKTGPTRTNVMDVICLLID
jgi:glycerate 2-kinase